jgi:hypothetical protein
MVVLMGQLVFLDSWAHLDSRDVLVLLDLLALSVKLDHRDPKELLDHQAQLGHKVSEVSRAIMGRQALKATLALSVHRAQRVTRASKVPEVHQDQLVRLGLLGTRAAEATTALPVQLDLRATLDSKVLRDRMDRLVSLDQLVTPDQSDLWELPDSRDSREERERPDLQGLLGQLAIRVAKDHRDSLEARDRPDQLELPDKQDTLACRDKVASKDSLEQLE